MLPSELDALARDCVPGRGEVILERVASGLVNETYRVSRDGRSFSLRLNAGRAADPGLDRPWECRVLRCASAALVAPTLVRCDPALGIVVTEWMNGSGWTAAECRQPGCIAELTSLLRAVHGLSVPKVPRVVNPAQWVAFYEGVELLSEPLRAEARVQLACLAHMAPVQPVLCHGDVHRLNLVIDRGARLLDWEYAHVADPFWDLAGWVANEDWDAASAHALLTSYLRRSATREEEMRLAHLAWLYDFVCLSWSRLYLRQVNPSGAVSVAARAALLEQRLARRG